MIKTRVGDIVGESDQVMRLWPDAGKRLKLSKTATYAAAHRGEIPVVWFSRLAKVPVPAFNRMLETGEQPGAERVRRGR